jgi:rare lipoprotein A
MLFFVLIAILFLSACGQPKAARVDVPSPPPPINTDASTHPSANLPNSKTIPNPKPDATSDLAEPTLPPHAHPLATETGLASWYGPPYHNRRGSNGEVYNMHAMTAAHLTLPLGSIARITNVKTGHSALVRITDRGPFVPGRIVDLSLAAAKALDVYVPGTAKIRLEVLQTPAPLDTGGRWAVQIGSFAGQNAAAELAQHLQKRYQTAKVVKFVSPVGDWWVRVRVLDDDRQRATTLAHETETAEGAVFLVRLD